MAELGFKDILPKGDAEFYRQLLDHIGDGVYFVDRDRKILYWNKGAERITGFSADELVGHHCQDAVLEHVDSNGRSLCREGCPLLECMQNSSQHQGHIFLHKKDGGRVPIKVRTQPLLDAAGAVVGAVEIFSDASAEYEMRRRSESMQRMAYLDHLTQLPNRRYMELTLRSLLNGATEGAPEFGVLLLDLDKLKQVNDEHGHSSGDLALREAGQALAGALRPSDLVGRWGGDEYLAIVHNVNTQILGELALRCVMLTERKRLQSQGGEFGLSISAGATMARWGDTLDALVQRADELLYSSKAQGGGRATMD